MFTPVESSFGAFLLHLSTTSLLLGCGRVLGASGVMSRATSAENIPLVAGVGVSALVSWYYDVWWMPTYDGAPEVFGPWSWPLCGALVGVGTKYSNGCTSGHMLCGIPLRRVRSFLASATFSATSLVTVTLVRLARPTANACGEMPCYAPTYPSPSRFASLLAIATLCAAVTYAGLPLRPPKPLVSLWSGALFGLGLMVSGMASPAKPLGFFTVGWNWDPSFLLLPVFGMVPNYLVWRRVDPEKVYSAVGGAATPGLVGGAAVFGVGWGLLGVCPGPGMLGGFLGGWRGALWVTGFLVGGWVA